VLLTEQRLGCWADLHNYVQEYIWDSIIHSITWSNDYAIIMQIIAQQFDTTQAKQMVRPRASVAKAIFSSADL